MSAEECVQQQKRRKRIWRSGEFDADPFGLPQHVAVKATNTVERAFGFIRYATVYAGCA